MIGISLVTLFSFFASFACVVRALAHGEDLLQGMLSADIVRFHAFDYARYVISTLKAFYSLPSRLHVAYCAFSG